MSVQQYSVRWKEVSTVVIFVCQLMDFVVVRAITVLGELNYEISVQQYGVRWKEDSTVVMFVIS